MILTLVGVETEPDFPDDFILYQNYPNPFNSSTKIQFTIPSVIASGAKQSSLVTLKIYDMLGNEVATLVSEEKQPGVYEVDFSTKGGSASGRNANNLSSGIYFYQLMVLGSESNLEQGMVQTKKMIYLK